MPPSLSGSVGLDGDNEHDDVVTVQDLLRAQGQDPGPSSGDCGPSTIAAIRAFQATFTEHPDGKVDVDGMTWKRLNGQQPPAPAGTGFTALLSRSSIGAFNQGLVAVSNASMTAMFGSPRDDYSQDCQPMANATLRHNVTLQSVGPFRVSGLAPAVESLKQVFAEVQQQQPGVYARLGSAGMLCCRFQRGSTTQISNHSWGTAIDLTIDGHLDAPGDNMVQTGLTLIAPMFNRFGWYWGAVFPREDAMHFEASATLAQSIKDRLV